MTSVLSTRLPEAQKEGASERDGVGLGRDEGTRREEGECSGPWPDHPKCQEKMEVRDLAHPPSIMTMPGGMVHTDVCAYVDILVVPVTVVLMTVVPVGFNMCK